MNIYRIRVSQIIYIIILLVCCGCGGSDSSQKYSLLTKEIQEPPGDNCIAGGIKLTSGLDQNNNNTLENQEIDSTDFVCIDSAPPPPVLSLSLQSAKAFSFAWTRSSRTIEYKLLENIDSHSGYNLIGTFRPDTLDYEHIAYIPDRINASYILEACNSFGCTSSNQLSIRSSFNINKPVGFLKAPDFKSDEHFGSSIALSDNGQVLVVSARIYRTSTSSDYPYPNGTVYIYLRSGKNWILQKTINAKSLETDTYIGRSVAVSADGTSILISSEQDYFGRPFDSIEHINGAYILNRVDGAWETKQFIASNNMDIYADPVAIHGLHVSISGNGEVAAVTLASSYSGTTDIYFNNGEDWVLQKTIFARGALWRFGNPALSHDGQLLAIGEYNVGGQDPVKPEKQLLESDGFSKDLPRAGYIYFFQNIANEWVHSNTLIPEQPDLHDHFGKYIDLSADGNTIAISGWYSGDAEDSRHGESVHIFSQYNSHWSREDILRPMEIHGARLGRQLSLASDGNAIAISAPEEVGIHPGINGYNSATSFGRGGFEIYRGAVYVFRRQATDWTHHDYIKSIVPWGYRFGHAVALDNSGESLAVGVPNDNFDELPTGRFGYSASYANSGSVYIY